MSKKLLYISICICLCACTIFYTGCINGKLVWADNSVTQTNGIDVVVKELNKKQFILGKDDDELVSKFSSFGELVQLNIEIKGETKLNELKYSTTGMKYDQNHIAYASKDQKECDYFTDWIKIKVYMPKDAVFVSFGEEQEDIFIDKPKMTEDTYFKKNLEWVKVDKLKTKAELEIGRAHV